MTTTQIIIYSIICLCVIFFLFSRIRRSSVRLINISKPRIVLLQIGTTSQNLLDTDAAIYSDFYSNITTKTVNTIKEARDFIETSSFDLFHVFVDIDKEGYIYDSSQNKLPISTIVNMMQSGEAKYIIFAKDNPADGYISKAKEIDQKANIAMTIERKGENFAEFFKKIFRKVSMGRSFPESWNDIAPQIPHSSHENGPEMIAVMDAGNVVLLADK